MRMNIICCSRYRVRVMNGGVMKTQCQGRFFVDGGRREKSLM